MSEQKNISQKTEAPKRKRETFEILAIGLDCAGGVDQEIEVVYNLRYKSVILYHRREKIQFDGTWPDEPWDDSWLGVDYKDVASSVDAAAHGLGIKFTERQEREIRYHINVWLLRLYARLLQVMQPESEYTQASLREANAAAKAFGYKWEDDPL
jgi:hypothetical protein